MDVFHHFQSVPDRARGCVLAIGNFDGVHLGHQRLLAATRTAGRALMVPAAVLTFDPHPRVLMRPGGAAFGLSATAAKLEHLRRQRMSYCFVARFDHGLAATSPRDFVADWLVGRLGVRRVLVGEGYRFGHRREGDTDLLRRLGRRLGFAVTEVAPLRDGAGEVVSSTRIRAALASGRPREAASLLGRPWEIGTAVLREGARVVVAPAAGYQPPVAGTYAVATAADWADIPSAPATSLGRVVRRAGGAGWDLLLPSGAVPTDESHLRVRLLDLVERHSG